MELINILKMAAGYPLATFLHERCIANRSRTIFRWWCACPNVVASIWTVITFIPPYTCMHLRFRVPIKLPVTLSEHCISHSARFKNTMIMFLKTSTDPQISKGIDAVKLRIWRKEGYRSPLLSPLPKIRAREIPAHDPGRTGILLIPPPPGDNTLSNVC